MRSKEPSDLTGEHALVHLDRAELDRLIPGLREQWTGAWYEASCADIEVAAFHAACLAAIRRAGRRGADRRGAALGAPVGRRLGGRNRRRPDSRPAILVNAAGAWADEVAERARSRAARAAAEAADGGPAARRPDGPRDLPLVTDLHDSFYFKGEGDSSVWVSPLDETPVDPCDAAPEEIDVATAIDRFEKAVDWPVEAVERKWAGLRTFAPDRAMKFGFDPDAPGFFWCVGQGGMGIQTAPAASLLCAALIRGEALPAELAGIDPADFAPRYAPSAAHPPRRRRARRRGRSRGGRCGP